jgi:hypothetical protein
MIGEPRDFPIDENGMSVRSINLSLIHSLNEPVSWLG